MIWLSNDDDCTPIYSQSDAFHFRQPCNPTYSKERERWALYSSHSTNGDRPSAVLMKVVVHQYITRLHLLGVPVTKGCGDALFCLNKRITYQSICPTVVSFANTFHFRQPYKSYLFKEGLEFYLEFQIKFRERVEK
uniref:Uncharacterized protein n=1 Tax=Vitis vinifera TaxID=29760 RepID=F6HK63_VITVI